MSNGKMLLVGVAVPSSGEWKVDFALSLLEIQRALIQHPKVKGYTGVGLKIFCQRGSMLAQQRQGLVDKAIEGGCSHVLFLDDDMVFPPHLIHMLASHHRNVVACNCPTKAIPGSPTARTFVKGDAAGRPLYTTFGAKGLVKVWRVGTGVMLINLKVFEKIPKPWFDFTWKEGYDATEGEDWYLCKKFEEAGVEVFVDQEASAFIGHIGSYVYTHDDVALPDDQDKQLIQGVK